MCAQCFLSTWQRPTLPQSLPCSTIGTVKLNRRVRNGNGCYPSDITTRYLYLVIQSIFSENCIRKLKANFLVKPSTYQYESAECVATLTPLTYQPRVLRGVLLAYAMGNLILRWASRLDAFSVYPFTTQLPSYAPGGTTGAPEVSPSRSSRTKDSSSQISYARDGQGPNCLTTF